MNTNMTWLQLQVVCVLAVAGGSSGKEEDSKGAESSHSAGYSVIHSLPPAPTSAFPHHQVGPINIDIDSVMNTRASNFKQRFKQASNFVFITVMM